MKQFFLLTLIGISFLWLRSGFGKLLEGNFPQTLGGTLTHFASENPHIWYQAFLHDLAIPNSLVFGYLVMYGELFAGITIFVVSLWLLLKKSRPRFLLVLFLLGLVVGTFQNATFWLASGHLSPSGDSLNLLMFYIQILGIMFVIQVFRKKEARENG